MKWIVLFTVLATVNILGLLYLFYCFRRVENQRIAELTRVVRLIGDGSMTETAPEHNDHFHDLACAVNDMSANIQEALILLWKQSSQSRRLINRLAGIHRRGDKIEPDNLALILQQCKEAEQSHDDCQKLLFGFEFYGVNLDTQGAWHHNPEKEPDQMPEYKYDNKSGIAAEKKKPFFNIHPRR